MPELVLFLLGIVLLCCAAVSFFIHELDPTASAVPVPYFVYLKPMGIISILLSIVFFLGNRYG